MTFERRVAARGISLVETLISLAIVGFGFLAVSAMQSNLHRHAETSRQRATATRLAHEKLEQMRGYASLGDGGNELAWGDLSSGHDEPSTDGSSFVRRWAVSGGPTEGLRVASVAVSWHGHSAGVTLTTVFAGNDPIDGASLAVPSPGGAIRHVRQRHVSIPFRASSLGGRNKGKSTMAWPGGGHIVFDDTDGTVIARCADEPDDQTDIAKQCTAFNGSMLEGYIGGIDLPDTLAIQLAAEHGDSASAAPGECVVGRAGRGKGDRPAPSVYRYQCLARAGSDGRLRFSGLPAGVTVCRYAAGTRDEIIEKYTRAAKPAERLNFLVSAGTDCPDDTTPYIGD